jgi:hypothetical protein
MWNDMVKIKTGKIIIPYGANPEPHELETAKFFRKFVKCIEFIPLSYSKNIRTADIKMGGLLWEIKSPKGSSSRTIENNMRAALKQSQNLIIDLRRIQLSEQKAISQIKYNFKLSEKIRRLLIITKKQELIDMKK